MKQNSFLNSLILSFTRIRARAIELPMPILSDMLFLFLYGFLVMGLIAPLISAQMFSLGMQLTKTEDQSASLSQMLFQEGARPMLVKVVLLLLLMILLAYILYCLFQGFSWWCCRKIAATGKQPQFSDYLKVFYRTNIYWYILVVLYNIIAFAGDFLSEEGSTKGIFFTVSFFIFIYFVMVSYSLLPETYGFSNIKESFITGIRRAKDILPAYLVILAALFLINLLMNYSMNMSNMLFLAAGVFVLMPSITWARTYMLVVSRPKTK